LDALNLGYKYNFPSTNSTHIKQNMIAEAQIAIIKLQIDDIQNAKYQIAKYINKITTKHTQNPTKEEHQKLKTLQNVKRKLKNKNDSIASCAIWL
jgi:hypothetical protein